MKMILRTPRALRLLAAGLTVAAALAATAQTTVRRLSVAPSASAARVPLEGSLTERPARATAMGHLGGDTQLQGMSLVLKPTAAQSAALDQLLADQQNPASASYHQWLTPAQFGARFGLGDEDLAVLKSWLQARGFSIDDVAASRNRIVFSGSASAVENAFSTSLQRYTLGEQSFFENSTALQIPAALAGVIGGVSGTSNYHLPAPQAVRKALPMSQANPMYTTTSGTNHYIVPWDIRQMYGGNTLLSSGYDGTGIKIAVIGQSAVSTTQLTYFQQKTGQTVKLPTMVLVPNSGVSNTITGDEGESELDLEYASGTAPGATVLFVYTGCGTTSAALSNSNTCTNNGVFDAIAYAITNNLAPILSLSYGGCEASNASYANTVLEPILKQANTQGQTIFVSTGDTGAASCETASAPTVATGGLTVSYPASSAYVSAVGGTQLNDNTTTSWAPSNNSFAGSALGYIPEVAWNETSTYGSLASTGGGASAIFGKPSWQTGPGVPSDGKRDIPDISLPAGVVTNGYIVCTGDSGSTAACSNSTVGFATGGGSLIGGTSASTPNVAALLAIIEQANGGGALGNINASLYTLAAGSSYNTIFHDITSGTNIVTCRGGTVGCSSTVSTANGTMGFSTGTGYDQVTGLGTFSASALQTALKSIASTSGLLTPTVVLTASNTAPSVSTAVTFTASVTGSGTSPTGTVTFSVDGTTVGSAVTLSSGTATYSYSGFSTSGTHFVLATYSGNSAYTAGTSTINVTATGTAAGSAGITLAASPSALTITRGSSGAETLTVTSVNGFTGSVSFTAALTSSTGTFSGCYAVTPSTVSPAANSTATTSMTIYTSTSSCTNSGAVSLRSAPLVGLRTPATVPSSPFGRTGLVVLSAGLMGCFVLRRRIRVTGLLAIAGFALALGLGGCASSSSSTSTTTTSTTTSTAGTYVIQVTATSVSTSTIAATSSFTLTVQ